MRTPAFFLSAVRRRKSACRNRVNRRWLRWLGGLAVVFLVLSVLPVLVWRWAPPPLSAVMLQRAVGNLSWPEYAWVAMDRISADAALAVVAAEDQHFPDHSGFDLDALQAAWRHNQEGGRLRGASTISQQVAKNLFLWEGRSYLRKGLEAWFTLLIEGLWPKSRILEVYLNIAEMGENVFGVEAASRRYFDEPAKSLSARQAALLAAALPNPRHYLVSSPNGAMIGRRDWILRQMRQLGGVDYLRPVLMPTGT